MVLNLRSCLSAISILCIQSCLTPPQQPVKEEKKQLVIVLDKSSSVTYNKKLSNIQSELKRSFQEMYAHAFRDIQWSKFVINGDTRIFPEPERFNLPCPNAAPESRSEMQALQNWQMEKAKWINNQITKTIKEIEVSPYSSSTDVYSIFSGLQEVQRVDGPWDAIKVMIFSDMIHTVSGRNMKRGLTAANAFEKGKEQCRELVSQGNIKKGNIDNLYLTVYTPDNMPESAIISTYWKGFFEEWGLPDTQYHFEY